MTAEGVPFMVVVEVDCRFGRSAQGLSEARIARTGRVYFLMQECCLIVNYINNGINSLTIMVDLNKVPFIIKKR